MSAESATRAEYRISILAVSRGNRPKPGFRTTAGRTTHVRDAACPGVLAEKELDTCEVPPLRSKVQWLPSSLERSRIMFLENILDRM